MFLFPDTYMSNWFSYAGGDKYCSSLTSGKKTPWQAKAIQHVKSFDMYACKI